jgi:hypothetical protein
MKKFFLGVLVGAVLTALVCVPLVLWNHQYQFDSGRNYGKTECRREIAETMSKEFDLYDGKTPYKVLFSIKTTDVIALETNGIKTVRIIP